MHIGLFNTFFLTLQVVLGIVTLLSNVYFPLASMHQTNSILLLSTLLIEVIININIERLNMSEKKILVLEEDQVQLVKP